MKNLAAAWAVSARTFRRELAVQDWICLVYLGVLLAATIAGDGPRRTRALVYLSADLAAFVVALILTRAKLLGGVAAALVYRAGVFAAVFGSFAHLQYILPTVRSSVVDAKLYALDLAVFHVEPAVFFDRFVTPATTEWFAFFYFGYFFLIAGHVLAFMFGTRRTELIAELALGIVLVFCVGHLLYIAVPGHGPYHHLAPVFQHELDGPVWWRLVKATVDSVEVTARTDIFPSLHTAAPVYLALFALRHRRVAPFRFLWLPIALFSSQIVISTMFLRWHYLVDVIAGLTLAVGVSIVSGRVARWEVRRRSELGKDPVWTAPWRSPDAAAPVGSRLLARLQLRS